MKINLEKELAMQMTPAKTQSWIKFIAGVCVLNLVLVIIALFSGRSPKPVQTIVEPDRSSLNAIEKVDSRLKSLEKTFRELKANQKKTKKTLSVVAAEHGISKKKDRMLKRELKKAGVTEMDMRNALRKTMLPRQFVVMLDDQEKNNINALIDSDDSAFRVRDYIASVTNLYKRTAYLEYLRKKGDEWLEAALPLISENRNDFDDYLDNAFYFYDIVSALSENNAMIAYVESKKNQAELVMQNSDIQMEAEEAAMQQEMIDDIKEELEPKMSREEVLDELRERRKHIKKYPTSDIIRKYKSDWEIDPNKRLEQKRKEEAEAE